MEKILKDWPKFEGGDNYSIDLVFNSGATISVDRRNRYSNDMSMTREEMGKCALLISKAPDMLEAMIEFCQRVDKGEIKSTYTYHKFKKLIAEATELS